ncbi:MAG: MBL fold metallo-hydrolase [Coriobacteriales bacterium]|jgi:glyoxylase-like metal-dependent hydrolase (beta-lactamase superfamily II)|nr:MBL fold metallo-hydrolase [Coriobacteriales bacterium]
MPVHVERVEVEVAPGFIENCYLVNDVADARRVVVVDPGAQPERIHAALGGRTVERIVLTHRHFDHTGALSALVQAGAAEVVAHALDADAVCDPVTSGAVPHGLVPPSTPATATVEDGDYVPVGSARLRVIHTPGHTVGSMCLYDEEGAVLLSGDTLFFETCGRTDFPTGNARQMRESLQRLARLPGRTVVHPGHDVDTTIAHELQHGALRPRNAD